MFQRKRKASDFSDEVRSHIEIETQRLREQGLSEKEARSQALRGFGNVMGAEERFYESRRAVWLDCFWQDIRYALRMMRKSPGFAAVIILTIALGIGASTAIFSVVDATLLHPLPYPHPEQLVSIVDDLPGAGVYDVGMSVPEWHDFQRSGIFDYVSTIGGGDVNLTGASQPTRIRFLNIPPNYFALLGVKPELGSSFDPNDQTPGFTLDALISDGLWKRVFASDPAILGKNLRLDNDLYRIIGVMPPDYHDPGRTTEERNVEIWLASGFAAPPAPAPARNSRLLVRSIARIKPGQTLAEAQSRLDAMVASLQEQFPNDYPAQGRWTVRLVPLKESVVGNVRQPLILLLAAVGLVVLIGCANVANLLLARTSARSREMAVRQTLGAARTRLVRQLLTESLFLSLLGGIAGLGILYSLKNFLLRLLPESLPRLNNIAVSWRVLLFALGVSIVAGTIFGLAPSLQAGRLDLTHFLKREGRGSTGSGEQARTRHALVVTEFALSLVLMIAAGLLLRSFGDLLNVPLGFNPQNVMAIRTWLPIPNDPKTDIYGTPAQEAPFLREVIRRSKTLPGVEEAAIGDLESIPLRNVRNDLNPVPLFLEGSEGQSSQPPLVNRATVTPEYFQLIGMTLLRGRLFSDADNENAAGSVVVNDAFAAKYFANVEPLGKHLKLNVPASPWSTIVGVIANARTESLADATVPQVYVSAYQRRPKDLAIFLKGRLDSAAIPVEVRAQVQAVNPELPVFGAQMITEKVAESLDERRFLMDMVALFALTALLLAAIGIYGVISYVVSERTHEFGIRLALGAQRANIMRMVLRQGLGLAITGAAIGLAGAVIESRLMAGLLYGVRPSDPLTFTGVAVLLTGVALAACYLPARRAIRVDPIVALRSE